MSGRRGGGVGRRGVEVADLGRGRQRAGCALVAVGGGGWWWRTFSAPRICTVEAGCLARFMSEPACAINLAPTSSPTTVVRLGAIAWQPRTARQRVHVPCACAVSMCRVHVP